MKTGKMWFKVPEVINVRLDGKLKEEVMAKDVILFLLGELGTAFAVYKTVEFTGSIVSDMSIEERMTLCNMAVEMGAKNAYIQPDEKTIEYVKSRTDEEFTIYETDEDFEYDEIRKFDLSYLVPSATLFPAIISAKASISFILPPVHEPRKT